MTRRVVVVGAGLAGLRLAEGLRRFGFEGSLVLLGEEPEPPYDRPPLSKDVLTGARELDSLTFRSADELAELEVDFRGGARVTSVDRARKVVVLDSGEEVGYDDLVVATGVGARTLPGSEAVPGVHRLRTLADARALAADLDGARQVTVVGGGFIGCEIASSMRSIGIAVDLVEPQAVPLLGALGPWVGERIAQMHRAHGVRLHLGVGVRSVRAEDGRPRIELDDGAVLTPDVAVVGIGSVPAVSFLEGSGLDIDNGLLCDADGRTADPCIWALGDVARRTAADGTSPRRVEHWTTAGDHADQLARLLTGSPPPRLAPVDYVWSDQYGHKLQVLGQVPSGEAPRVLLEDGERFLVAYGSGGRLAAVVGLGVARELMRLRGAVAEGAPMDQVATERVAQPSGA